MAWTKSKVAIWTLLALLGWAAVNWLSAAPHRKALELQQQAEVAAKVAEKIGAAARADRERAQFALDSLEGVARGHARVARLEAARADSAASVADTLTVRFREVLPIEMQARFDSLIATHIAVRDNLRQALESSQMQVLSLEQALVQARHQIAVEASAHEALRSALAASQAEAQAWEQAANPGFLRDLWGDLPKLAVAVGVGVALTTFLTP